MNEINRLDNILCFSLYSVTNALMRQYRPYLKEFDLTYPQFVVLLALYEKDNISLKELGEKTLFDSGTLTPLVQKLEAKGYLNRVPVPEDERVKKALLTDKARELQTRISDIPNQLRCSISMNDQQLTTLRQLSHQLLEDL
ncbi:MarR family winged helix-turn-helix transcriptional regulator [Tatumella citrea]|uniref:HTH-type transcriptional regulator SarZ n=1 Tax=Tatumella citrea TaxID=53336 RepID=A0A1Y0LDS4_TATCI|nr:MarR family transcriptional regulator [Tatumella citrea]ARU95819.1 MarR family transcriptional regulator [Tatumella citrea]ARU99859.1 MarR family transcriptional regulator [Tatumella citrea]